MATPMEQHGARGRAHVVGSGHRDGRQPLDEERAAAGADASSGADEQEAASRPMPLRHPTPIEDETDW